MTENKKILIVCLDNMGDTIMASAVIPSIKKNFPSCELGLWVKDYSKDLFDGHSLINYLHACDPFWDRSPGKNKGSYKQFFSTLREIKKVGYDAALFLNAEWRRCLYIWLLGIKERVGLDQRKSRTFLSTPMTLSNRPEYSHMIQRHRFLVEMWLGRSFNEKEFLPSIEISDQHRRWAESFLRERNSELKRKVFIHPFSGDERKNWDLSNWKKIISSAELQKRPTTFFIITSPSEKLKLEGKIETNERCVIVPSVGLPKIGALLRMADLFIGGDSGPGHLAAAVGSNTISLFGPGWPEKFKPCGTGTLNLIKKDQMNQITVEEVLELAQKMLLIDRKSIRHPQNQ